MEHCSFSGGLEAGVGADYLALSGDLTRLNGQELLSWLQALPAITCFDLADLDIEDGVAATEAVNAVRLLSSRVTRLRIIAAPQVLAHNLYRTGMLATGKIELVDMREDEAFG
jgi:hypothetical protein